MKTLVLNPSGYYILTDVKILEQELAHSTGCQLKKEGIFFKKEKLGIL